MNEALLHPIVIPAIKCEPFECLGDGLLHDGIEREQPNTLKDLLAPTKTSKRTPIEDRERPKKWWKAQCFHYGIQVSSSAPISTYRVHLESAIRQRGGLKRPQNLADLEFEQNTKFRLLNAQVRDATTGGSQSKSSKSKTKATNPKQVIATEPAPAKTKPKAAAEPKAKPEAKPKAESKQKAKEPKAKPEVKTKVETKIKTRAEPQATTDPALKATKKRKADTVVHVYHYDGGKAASALFTPNIEVEVAHRPTKKARTTASSSSAGIRGHSSSQPQASNFGLPPSYSQVAPHPKQTARRSPFSSMSGTYELTCSSEAKWRSPSGCRPTLSVEISEHSDSWVTGVLELPGLMVCALRLKPGLSCPSDGYIRFEWCGHDEVEDHIIPPDQYYVGWMKLNEKARQVKGMIEGYCGEINFSGHKVGATSRGFPAYSWDEFGMDAAYEEEDACRWE